MNVLPHIHTALFISNCWASHTRRHTHTHEFDWRFRVVYTQNSRHEKQRNSSAAWMTVPYTVLLFLTVFYCYHNICRFDSIQLICLFIFCVKSCKFISFSIACCCVSFVILLVKLKIKIKMIWFRVKLCRNFLIWFVLLSRLFSCKKNVRKWLR